MNTATQRVARFGLLTALALVLGLLDRAIPLTALLGGAAPGIKLGLANTVLLYAVYLMDWHSAVFLMLAKVVLSGFLFGSLTAILYSLSGGVLEAASLDTGLRVVLNDLKKKVTPPSGAKLVQVNPLLTDEEQGKFFLASNTLSGQNKLEIFTFGNDEQIKTYIDNVVMDEEDDTKVMGIFNLNGQRLSAPQKGINIINGKKVMVK